MTQQLI